MQYNDFKRITSIDYTAKDLGVLLDEKLNFSKHVDGIVSDANRLEDPCLY